jgi:hypothetical protein
VSSVLVRRAVVVALMAEALGFAAYAGYLAVLTVREPPTSLGLPVGLVVLTGLLAALLTAAARSVANRRPTVRIPIVVWHILLGLTSAQGLPAAGSSLTAAPLLVVSLVAGLGVLVPGVLDDVSDDRRVGSA